MTKTIYKDTSLAILAGGGSKRLGADKTQFTRDGVLLVAHIYYQLIDYFNDIFLVTKCDMKFPAFPGRIICDQWKERASIIGVAEALRNALNPWVFIIPGDAVFFKRELLDNICTSPRDDADVIIPRINGNYEPLFGIYHKKLLPELLKSIENKSFKIHEHFSDWKSRALDIEVEDPRTILFNMNTAEDLSYAREQGWVDFS